MVSSSLALYIRKKTSYPNVKYFLYHSDNSLLPSHRGVHPPAARGHRGVIKNGNSAVNLGGALFWPMRESARKSECRLIPKLKRGNSFLI